MEFCSDCKTFAWDVDTKPWWKKTGPHTWSCTKCPQRATDWGGVIRGRVDIYEGWK